MENMTPIALNQLGLVPAPPAGGGSLFLSTDGWAEATEDAYFLAADGNWRLGSNDIAYLRGDGTWDYMELADGYYAYLYDGNTLHFSNRKIRNHGSHVLTNSWEIPEEGTSGSSSVPWYGTSRAIIEKITTDGTFVAPKSIAAFFQNHSRLTDVAGLMSWDVSNVEAVSNLFYGCSSLEDVSAINWWNLTSKLTTMASMFNGCTKLKTVYGYGWDVSKVTSMARMFNSCESIQDVGNLLTWKTESLEDMQYMFYKCTALSNIAGLSRFDTSRVTSMNYLFRDCVNITSFTVLNSWDVSSVKSKSGVFQGTTGTRPTWGTSW